MINNPEVTHPNTLIEALDCVSWAMVDLEVYGAVGLDEVWIENKRVGVEMRALGAKMERAG